MSSKKIKLYIFLIAIMILGSCKGEEIDDLQKIDQIINLYLSDSNGLDLLNTENATAYKTITLLDLNDPNTAFKPITTFSIKKDAGNVSYLDYAAGATRILETTSGQYPENYQSEFYINLTKTISDVEVTDRDTIKILYLNDPKFFKVSKIWYNNKLVFTKVSDEANIVKIVK